MVAQISEFMERSFLHMGERHNQTSSDWGAGAYWKQSWKWPDSMASVHISIKELIPVVVAWGSQWSHSTVLAQCDNSAVVTVINSAYSRDPEIVHLLCCLHFFAARFEFILTASHIRGIHNSSADALLRDNRLLFRNCNHKQTQTQLWFHRYCVTY